MIRGGLFAAGALLALLVLLGIRGEAVAQATVQPPPSAQDCLACHADKELKRGTPKKGRPDSLFVDETMVKGSAHTSLECVACHTTATAPHEALPAVKCAACHDAARLALGDGVHGSRRAQTATPPATCTGCHGTHAVRPAKSLGVETCATCHRPEVAAYRQSVHGQSSQRGGTDAATCRSCHGPTHAVVTTKDPSAPTYHLNLPKTCARCHADPELVKRHNIPVGNVYKLYLDSIHGRALTRSGLLVAANCSDCHGTHEIKRRTDPASRVFRANIPKTCGGCHAGVLAEFAGSVHGQALAKGRDVAPVCTSCHSAHQIRRVEAASWQLDVIGECGTCHEESLKTYRDTFHGKVTTLGLARVAKCADCHGAHGIQPVSDPRSRVSTRNIVATCAQCHPGATPAFAQFHPHADPRQKERFPQLYYPYRFMTGLLIGVFGFFGLHSLLWLPRSLVERLRRRGGPAGASGDPGPDATPPPDPGDRESEP